MDNLDKEVLSGLFFIALIAILILTTIIPSMWEWIKKRFPNWWKRHICDELDKDDEGF